MVNTKKFSEFSTALQDEASQKVVGLENGINVQSDRFLTWETAGRPSMPFNGLLGFNTTLQMYEFYDADIAMWTQLEDSGDIANLLALLASHAVGEGASLIGLQNQGSVLNKTVQDFNEAPFIVQTDDGTLPNAQFLADLTTGIVKNTTVTGALSISAPLTSIDGLTTVANNMLYTTATDTYAVITPVNNALLISSAGGVPSWSNTAVPGFTMVGNLILNGDASVALQAVTLQQLQAAVLNAHPACFASTTADLAGYTYDNGAAGVGATLTAGANGAFTTDGVSPPLNARILVPFQTNQFENGIYVLTQVGDGSTPAILTRAADFDSSSNINAGDVVTIVQGTLYGGTFWMMTQTAAITVGTTDITFLEITNTGALLIANNLSELTGTAATARGNISAAESGANADITSMTGLTGVLRAPTAIEDANGNEVLQFASVPSAVNYIQISNRGTASAPLIQALGDDPSVNLRFTVKAGVFRFSDSTNTVPAEIELWNAANTFSVGLLCPAGLGADVAYTLPSADGSADFILKTNGSGILSFANGSQIAGTATNDSATAGNIGEIISSTVNIGSAVSLTSTVPANVTSISLTAGDWDIWGYVNTTVGAGTTTSAFSGAINTVSATMPIPSINTPRTAFNNQPSNANQLWLLPVGPCRQSVSSTTTIYLVADATFSTSTCSAYGWILARRRR